MAKRNSTVLKSKRSRILQDDENDWISPVATPIKPRRKPTGRSKTLETPASLGINDTTNGNADDSFDFEHLVADQSLADSPFPQTPPRRATYSYDTLYLVHGSPFCLSDFSSPTITYAFVRSDVPSPLPSTLVDNWLSEPQTVRQSNGAGENTKGGLVRKKCQEEIGSVFRLSTSRTTSSSSLDSASESLSSIDSSGEGVAVCCLDGSMISRSRPPTPTPSHV
ncbi:hypothetical protein WG66_000298 [Moniliophthora roreri]|uniref:Uncharacterized protein n=1 Tax=Moniliophthora roreri TaxID=221103 RepID=A0A0W0EZK4_MONRR|nr:hypothetical protein WG66_000298 [Moniliophthora roreri]